MMETPQQRAEQLLSDLRDMLVSVSSELAETKRKLHFYEHAQTGVDGRPVPLAELLTRLATAERRLLALERMSRAADRLVIAQSATADGESVSILLEGLGYAHSAESFASACDGAWNDFGHAFGYEAPGAPA